MCFFFWEKTWFWQNSRFLWKLSCKKAIKVVWWEFLEFFPLSCQIFQKRSGVFFPKNVEILRKSGDFPPKSGDFGHEKWWRYVAIFDRWGGDIYPQLSGSTANNNKWRIEWNFYKIYIFFIESSAQINRSAPKKCSKKVSNFYIFDW